MDPSAAQAAYDRFHPLHGDSTSRRSSSAGSTPPSPSPSSEPNADAAAAAADHRLRIALSKETLLRPFYPGEPKSLSGIALRAFCLGAALAASLATIALVLLLTSSPLWRAPFFLAALSAFHFLEFWTTAAGNPTVACVDSFLLTSNGPAYAIAHSAAFLECLVVGALFPDRAWAPEPLARALLAAGLLLTAAGQAVRSLAMLHAGASFNHHIQTTRADTHALVTTGVYGFVRHPSYAAFFYWGLGTQLVLGNVVCFAGYAAVLWLFFSRRIRIEEEKLVEFFHEDYVNYRKRVGTWIPFIQ
ncbi:Protein-S-isoprenylcysteine O-methyltransferase [Escovopsis weberi]|uniref:Protein-S-isoprenylcysteine O-methyltransferase n=1 Tax=Escovopsis weberi TaxID=150374 RepID=A0A0M8N2K4_ESCWE|nr:Protein-S-isoprenylcysteine O-methyltransferase [Escovopsis weberi]